MCVTAYQYTQTLEVSEVGARGKAEENGGQESDSYTNVSSH